MLGNIARNARPFLLGFKAFHSEANIGSVETRDYFRGVTQAEKRGDVVAHALSSSGSERHHNRSLFERLYELTNGQIRRAKILPPLGYAMGFVHRNQGHFHLRDEFPKYGVGKALRRNVHDFVRPLYGSLHHRALLTRSERRIKVGSTHARFNKSAHLIAHKRHERRNNQGKAGHDNARDLIAHGFARTRGHDAQGVAALQDGLHDELLSGAKITIPEITRKRGAGIVQRR